ncbi:MAG: hypothetical protein HFF50_05415 [Lawsonibacter sp.]|nr:hypothetical protein [Lawsonibacter sp.]
MLIKQLFTGGGDYQRALRQRRWTAAAMAVAGLTGLACYFLLVPSSGLGDYARGFYLGAAGGCTWGALILLVRTQYLITHPQAQRKAQIKERDERELQITRTAAQMAGGITVFGAVLGLFVVLPLNMAAFYALFAVVVFYAAIFVLSSLWLSRRL